MSDKNVQDVIFLTQSLIRCRSITPSDAGCQQLIADLLEAAGFSVRHLDRGQVNNLYATHGTGKPLFVFLGHTDVVPVGDFSLWTTPPFAAEITGDRLIGRGVADMKGGVAAFVSAAIDFVSAHPDHPGSIGILLTSNEEGDAQDAIPDVVAQFQADGVEIDYCLIGEPSSEDRFGDVIKTGRRGSLNATLQFFGTQQHIAQTRSQENLIHQVLAVLSEITALSWDDATEGFPNTALNCSNIHAGLGVSNVTPEKLLLMFNVRFSPRTTAKEIQFQIEAILNRYPFTYQIDWDFSGNPFHFPPGMLAKTTARAIEKYTGLTPEYSCSGGTSDGRFLAPLCRDLIEFGLRQESIHQVNEYALVSELEALQQIYLDVLQDLMR